MVRDRREYLKEYDRNRRDKDKKRELARRARILHAEVMRCIKEGTPCADCGNFFPHYVMQFDHREGNPDRNYITMMLPDFQKALEEMEKCDLVCANCHCVRTWERSEGASDALEREKEAD